MAEENGGFFNSPLKITHKITPIKRLGLSRKRKSCGSGYNLSSKIHICNETVSNNYTHSDKFLAVKETDNTRKDFQNEENNPTENYDDEIQSLMNRIAEDEKKLESIKFNKTNITQLEGLIDLWKNGCKTAFLHLIQLLKEREAENIDLKTILNKLGIWETMIANFGDDSDIPLSEFSQ